MSYSICIVDDTATFDVYTLPSRMVTVDDLFDNFWKGKRFSGVGNKLAERPVDSIPVFMWNPVDVEHTQELLMNSLIKSSILLLGIAKEKNVRRAVIMFRLDKRLSDDSSMEWIDIKSAIFEYGL